MEGRLGIQGEACRMRERVSAGASWFDGRGPADDDVGVDVRGGGGRWAQLSSQRMGLRVCRLNAAVDIGSH